VFSHIFTAVTDFERALSFYEAVLAELGIRQRFVDRSRPWAAWQSSPEPRPLFLIGTPYDRNMHQPGNGQMVAFLAANRSEVDSAYRTALARGGLDEGAPGLRPEYHANYYGAYFRDPDGNKICIACHAAPASAAVGA
jgi:lactoylglutathione lyase